jgi:hypothetical protein
MITIRFDDLKMFKDISNIANYGIGFIDGVKQSKPVLLTNLGIEVTAMVEGYIDSMARVDPTFLQHVYEWYQSGNADARLFSIDYSISGTGIRISSSFNQSTSIKDGSNVAFADKARIMEDGIPVTIAPKNGSVLAFEIDGEQIFTSTPVTIANPGGDVAGNLSSTITQFFSSYLSQAMMETIGVMRNMKNPIDFDRNFAAGKARGHAAGFSAGAQWTTRKV